MIFDLKVRELGLRTSCTSTSIAPRTPEEIVTHFYTITLEQVYATILYYLHNKEAVSTYIADWLEHGHKAREEQKRNPPPVSEKLRKMRAQREAMKKANES